MNFFKCKEWPHNKVNTSTLELQGFERTKRKRLNEIKTRLWNSHLEDQHLPANDQTLLANSVWCSTDKEQGMSSIWCAQHLKVRCEWMTQPEQWNNSTGAISVNKTTCTCTTQEIIQTILKSITIHLILCSQFSKQYTELELSITQILHLNGYLLEPSGQIVQSSWTKRKITGMNLKLWMLFIF